ncbi:MAG: ceramidase domain-containing protein [Bacteriovoracales bacterium]
MVDLTNCPWGKLEPAKLWFCEAPLCSIVHRPSETYSSFAFVIAGLYIYKKADKSKNFHYLIFTLLAVFIGLTSAAMHATSSRIGEIMDVSSMFGIVNFCIVIGLKRKYPSLSGLSQLGLFILFTIISSISLTIDNEAAGSAMFGSLILIGVITEYLMFKKAKVKPNYWLLVKSIGLLLIGWGIWWLDILKIVCNPNNHIITGHAIWHCFCAVGIVYLWRFFDQFEYAPSPFIGKLDCKDCVH